MNRITDLLHPLSLSLSLCAPLPGGPHDPLRPTGRPPPLSVAGPVRQGKIPQSPALVPYSGHRLPVLILAPHAVTRTSGRVTSGHPTPPSLLDCRWSSFHAVVMRWQPAPQGTAAVSCDMPLQCPMLITMRQPTQHGPQVACLI
jgi:hypothetical protein